MRFFTKDNAKRLGSKGGKATVDKHGRNHMRELGNRLVAKYGAGHMREIGRLGFRVTCDRHYGGDEQALMAALQERGLLRNCDGELLMMKKLYQEVFPGMFEDL